TMSSTKKETMGTRRTRIALLLTPAMTTTRPPRQTKPTKLTTLTKLTAVCCCKRLDDFTCDEQRLCNFFADGTALRSTPIIRHRTPLPPDRKQLVADFVSYLSNVSQ